jgi:uncharacterized membrane protein YdfJ with MMPL/SSD domain
MGEVAKVTLERNPKRQAAAFRRMARGQQRASLFSITAVVAGIVGVALAYLRDWHGLAVAFFVLVVVSALIQYAKERLYLSDFRKKLAEIESKMDK